MICQRCGRNQATTHIKTLYNGKLEEYNLCSECAREIGVNPFEFGLPFTGMIESMLLGSVNKKTSEKCPVCGKSYDEIVKSGKIGCPNCYKFFSDRLLPIIQRYHGVSKYKGKAPVESGLIPLKDKSQLVVLESTELQKKKQQLKEAIEEQRYEDAAVLRDEIHDMEEKNAR
jgi:protein arginine kinase activator